MISAFGVDHGEISKLAVRPTGKLFKMPKAGKIFGRAGKSPSQQRGPTAGFKASQKAGQGTAKGFGAVGTAAGKGASGMGFKTLGEKMQGSPVKAGVTTSFIGGTAGYGVYGMIKKPKQPQTPGQVG
jgi:hypothetical protein